MWIQRAAFCLQEYIKHVEKNWLPSPGSQLAQEFCNTWLNSKPEVCHSFPHLTVPQTHAVPFCHESPWQTGTCCSKEEHCQWLLSHVVRNTQYRQVSNTVSNLFASMLFPRLARTPAAQALLRFTQSMAAKKLCLPVAAGTTLLCTAVSVAQLCPQLLGSSGNAQAWPLPFSGQIRGFPSSS